MLRNSAADAVDAVDTLCDAVALVEHYSSGDPALLDDLTEAVLAAYSFGTLPRRLNRATEVLAAAVAAAPMGDHAVDRWAVAVRVALSLQWRETGDGADGAAAREHLRLARRLARLGQSRRPPSPLIALIAAHAHIGNALLLGDRGEIDSSRECIMEVDALVAHGGVLAPEFAAMMPRLRQVPDEAARLLSLGDPETTRRLAADLMAGVAAVSPDRREAAGAPSLWDFARLAAAETSGDRAVVRATFEDVFDVSLTRPDRTPTDPEERPRYLAAAGSAALELHRRNGDPALLDAAVSQLDQAWTSLGDHLPTTATAGMLVDLADACRLREGQVRSGAGHRRAVDVGARALRKYAHCVLLSDSPDDGLAVARLANKHVEHMAGSCLDDGDAMRTINVLEAGRGLVLHAATMYTTVPEMLRRSGRADLAEAWELAGAGTETAAELRRQALTALAGSPAGLVLLSAPGAGDLGPMVWGADLDAVVYLLPGSTGPGGAVQVRQDGAVEHLVLPRLQLASHGPQAATAEAHRLAFLDRDLTGVDMTSDPAALRWQAALDELCDWAYEAVVGPLLDHMRGWGMLRAPRLGLIPVGSLALTPWHAARRRQDGVERHACQDAVFSYAASARQLGDVTRRVRLPLDAAPVFVANPTQTQVWTSIGAAAAHEAYYPAATYLGLPVRLSGGALGTVEEVLQWLPSVQGDGASMLQLSSHACVHDSPTRSYFELAGGQRLSVAEVLDRARGRRAGAPGGLVICDSCMTDLTERDHDEVLTLGTALRPERSV